MPVPSILADQLISLPVKLKLPILLRAEVMLIVPVPASNVRAFPPPEIVLAIVILPLLALVLMVKLVVIARVVFASPKVTLPAPAVVLLVTIEPASVIALGLEGAKAPPE